MHPLHRDPGSPPTDPYRSTDLTPLDELIDSTPTPAQLDARRMLDAHASHRCHYIRPSGEHCGSPAMRDFDLCYYHDRYRPKSGYRNLPCLEDPHSVQCAIQEIVEDMLNGMLDYKKAALALYGLQTAASNLKQMRIAEQHREQQMNTGRTQETQRNLDSFGGDRLQPCRESTETVRASAPEVPVSFDDPEEFELVAAEMQIPRGQTAATRDDKPEAVSTDPSSASPASSCVHFDDDPPTTPLIESPRPPQHVTLGLTAAEKKRMKEVFPDRKTIRDEFLSTLTPEERAEVEASMTRQPEWPRAIAVH